MKLAELEQMSAEDLWMLHVNMSEVLKQKIQQEKSRLDERLHRLGTFPEPRRRPYPRVLPKYRNPDRPSETWAGRGKQPRWLVAQLNFGRRLDEFVIRG
jgi:DNA-binding protein H-NS